MLSGPQSIDIDIDALNWLDRISSYQYEPHPSWSLTGVVCIPLQSADFDSPLKASTSTVLASMITFIWHNGAQVLRFELLGRQVGHLVNAEHCCAVVGSLGCVLCVNLFQTRQESPEFDVSIPLRRVLCQL